jgi:hypothetical protein
MQFSWKSAKFEVNQRNFPKIGQNPEKFDKTASI